jgi:hypothetical protein
VDHGRLQEKTLARRAGVRARSGSEQGRGQSKVGVRARSGSEQGRGQEPIMGQRRGDLQQLCACLWLMAGGASRARLTSWTVAACPAQGAWSGLASGGGEGYRLAGQGAGAGVPGGRASGLAGLDERGGGGEQAAGVRIPAQCPVPGVGHQDQQRVWFPFAVKSGRAATYEARLTGPRVLVWVTAGRRGWRAGVR